MARFNSFAMKLFSILSFICVANGENIFYNYTKFLEKSIENLGFFDINSSSVSFALFTRNLSSPVQLKTGYLTNITQVHKGKVFKIITHGYKNNGSTPWMIQTMNAYLTAADYNVILVDWGKAANVLYPLSAGYTKCIGKYLGQLLYDLNKTLGVPFENMHLIGHSLGAHVSGFAGQYIQQFGSNVSRISGLDPAGPLFFLASSQNRLSNADAKFVDVIHTDSLKYGHILPLGDIDFYPNGGVAPQPGCNIFNYTQEVIDGCSHIRSHQLFMESISSNDLVASKCETIVSYTLGLCVMNPTAILGENINRNSTGIYQLATNAFPPYGRNGAI